MNKIKSIIIAYFLITCLMYAVDTKEDLAPYIMPKQLTYTSLPDDYDKRIEDYFQYHYQYLMVQDPNKTLMENEIISDNYLGCLSLEDFKKISLSHWILQNCYYKYRSEFSLVNSYDEDLRETNRELYKYSILDRILQLKTNKQNMINIKSDDSFSVTYHKIHKLNNYYYKPTDYVWIVGKITSYEKQNNNNYRYVILNIEVEQSLGGNLFPDKEIKIVFVYRGIDEFSLKDYDLSTTQKYLFPLQRSIKVRSLSAIERVNYLLTYPKHVLKVNNNQISRYNYLNFKEIYHVDKVTPEKIYDFFFEKERNVISIEEANQAILNYLLYWNDIMKRIYGNHILYYISNPITS